MKTIVGVLVVAAVATVGDSIWYTYGVRHTMVAGLVHGALLLTAVGAVLGAASGRVLKGLPIGALAGIGGAASYYVLVAVMDRRTYGSAIPAAWVIMWLILAALEGRWLRAPQRRTWAAIARTRPCRRRHRRAGVLPRDERSLGTSARRRPQLRRAVPRVGVRMGARTVRADPWRGPSATSASSRTLRRQHHWPRRRWSIPTGRSRPRNSSSVSIEVRPCAFSTFVPKASLPPATSRRREHPVHTGVVPHGRCARDGRGRAHSLLWPRPACPHRRHHPATRWPEADRLPERPLGGLAGRESPSRATRRPAVRQRDWHQRASRTRDCAAVRRATVLERSPMISLENGHRLHASGSSKTQRCRS